MLLLPYFFLRVKIKILRKLSKGLRCIILSHYEYKENQERKRKVRMAMKALLETKCPECGSQNISSHSRSASDIFLSKYYWITKIECSKCSWNQEWVGEGNLPPDAYLF